MPREAHQRALNKMLAQFPGGKTRGFFKALKAAIPDHYDEAFRLIPDAYWIDQKNEKIVVVEAEVTSPITEAKMGIYCELYLILDEHGWELVLKTVNRFGTVSVIDISDLALGVVLADAYAAVAEVRAKQPAIM